MQTIDRNSLNDLPAFVQAKIDKCEGFRTSFEDLCDNLNEPRDLEAEHQESDEKHREALENLLLFMVSVLREASEPLLDETFEGIRNGLENLLNDARSEQWGNIPNGIRAVLAELPHIPRLFPMPLLREANSLNEAMKNSRKNVRRLGTQLSNNYSKLEGSLQQDFNTAKEALASALESSQESASQSEQAARQHIESAEAIVADMRGLFNISSDLTWRGDHEASSVVDMQAANGMRIVAIKLYGLAIFLALAVSLLRIFPIASANLDWTSNLWIGGPVVVCLLAATYVSRESSEHRNSARLFKHQALSFASFGRYAERIADMEKGNVKRNIEPSERATKFLEDMSGPLFKNQIEAHSEQIKAQGRRRRPPFWQRGASED